MTEVNLALDLPAGVTLPEKIQPMEAPSRDMTDAEKATQLPKPAGYKILCILPDVTETFEGTNIVKASTYMKSEEHATTVLFVMGVGPDAYKDEKKFPNGPWCKEGDFVLVRTYTGTRFKIYGKEFRLINDDQVEAVVEDPRGITRAAI